MKKLFIVIILILLALLGFYFWWNNGERPADPTNKSQVSFIVHPQQNIRDIGYDLKRANLIRDPIVFFLIIKQKGLDGKIQAGNFQLSPSMSSADIAEALTHGTVDIWITIPEGIRATEIAAILKNKVSTYQPSWDNTLTAQEGYLFPDTYLLPKDADLNTIMTAMKNNFTTKYQQATAHTASKLTQDQVVTLASIVQREGKTESDMKLVASVLENRMTIGMPLEVDATVQYALGYQPKEKSWWKKTLTLDDLKINSLYNTYVNPGLPPTPISNPGSYALQAVLNTPQTSYLYYVSDSSGKLHFAKTLEEHNANISKYIQ